MKKLFTVLALTFITCLALSSCAEEEIRPNTTQGGGVEDGVKEGF